MVSGENTESGNSDSSSIPEQFDIQEEYIDGDDESWSGKNAGDAFHMGANDSSASLAASLGNTSVQDLQASATVGISYDVASVSEESERVSIMSPPLAIGSGVDVSEMLAEVLTSDVNQRRESDLPSLVDAENSEPILDGSCDDRVAWNDGLPEIGINHTDEMEKFLAQGRHYFIMSMGGKLIYSLHGEDSLIANYMGIIQAVVSHFQEEDDHSKKRPNEALKSFRAGECLFVFSIEDPILLVAIDRLGLSESQLRSQLDILYAQILSTLTKSQITKIFEERPNFDLGGLLGGTEVFLRALSKDMASGSPSVLLGSLECLKLRKSVREKINKVLIDCRTSTLLYGLVLSDSRLVSVIRPRRHSLHAPDLFLVFSMLFNTGSFKDGESWAPICLPKFNPTGFLYAYVNFFSKDSAVVLISPNKTSFFELREASGKILEQMKAQNLTDEVERSVAKGRFRTIDIPSPLIRHFLYKSKSNVQFIMPSFEPHFYDAASKQRLMLLYHQLHEIVHEKHGTLKTFYTVRHNTTALAYVTPKYEIYCVAGTTTKDALAESVKATISWIRHQEERLFILGGAVF